ncbi:reverse transcriptase domain-containing protein [Tanacetum coccineum]|uniref:Reverse transcriptase domain-containing protein n=1 Tax=Tanacetum coccineum TaxID=301880 RepID=A0ABQ5DI97_9ASTR
MEQISAAFLNEEGSAIVQNKLPPKLGDPGSFLIPCILENSVECLALADLGASINLMPYSLYVSLFENTLKPTRMSIRLANHTYQYPMGVAENMLVQVGKFIFPMDFVILQMEEDDKVPLILGRPFLHTVDAIIRVKNKELNLRTSIQDPPIDLEMKPLPNHLEYAFLEKDSLLPVVISTLLKEDEKKRLVSVLKNHKEGFAWKTSDILGISPSFDIDDNFPDETLINVSSNDEDEIPWFADLANYLVVKILRKGLTYTQRCKFFSELKHYSWDEPYLFKMCLNGMIKRCVYGSETQKILDECHHGPTRGHYGPSTTTKKVFDAGFYCPTIFKEAHTLVHNCDTCQHSGSLSRRDELPQKNIQAEAEALPTNDARVVINFLKKLFSQFGIPKALISDRAYHDRKFRIQKEFKARDKVLLYNSKYKFKTPKLRSKWYGPFMVKHGFPSGYVELYDKNGGRFIFNRHRVKLYHDEEQLNELSNKEIHLMCKEGKMKTILFMALFPADYRKTMPWVVEKPFIYSVVESTCNEAKLDDLDETGEVIVKRKFSLRQKGAK